MTMKRTIAAALMLALATVGTWAENYYDLTQYYLQNPDFTANVDYAADAAAERIPFFPIIQHCRTFQKTHLGSGGQLFGESV